MAVTGKMTKVSMQVDGEWVDLGKARNPKPMKNITLTLDGKMDIPSLISFIGPMQTHASPKAVCYQSERGKRVWL